ncbi:zinc finger, CCHC-type containing protein [Tanacetum coccineum]
MCSWFGLSGQTSVSFQTHGEFCSLVRPLAIFARSCVVDLIRMTTSVRNNSVFRSFFEKQKLTGPNFIDWYRQLRLVLSTEDKEKYLEQLIPAAPVAAALLDQPIPPQALATYNEWVKNQKKMEDYQAEQELLQTVRDFHTCKQEEGQSVSSYVLKMKSYIDQLERLGHPVTLNLGVSLILVGLSKEYDSFVQNYNMHIMGKTVNELHAMLKLHEETLPKKVAAPALHAIRAGKGKKAYANADPSYAPKPKNLPPPKKDNPAKDVICHHYGEVGHWRRNCPTYLTELLKKKQLAQGASTSGALSLYVGNGQREAVVAIGNYHLCLPSGLVIVLNNCHYAPSITRGIISVSCLYEDGFINRFELNNTISVSKNNVVYFTAILRDGLYEIEMSCSNTNDSYMYAVSNKRAKLNLDSSLLWHCRLGHISKKSIEKLQHDGLLNWKGLKMARKPYSHQVERAKDLLGLIHTDEHELGDLGEPANYKAALKDPESEKWLAAMNVEMQSMKDNDVWELVELPPNAKTVGHKWLFKKKTDMDGCNIRAIRILIAIAAFYDYEIWQMDVKTAFLNGHLSEEVYMTQPEGFVNPKYPNHVCKLKRSIYGLKQASRQWNKRFDDEIKKFDFTQNRDEPCVYQKASESYVTFLILYVDDILIMGNNIPMLQDVKSYIGKCFTMKDLGEAAYILGIKIYRDRSKRLIGLCQSAYIEKILKIYYMENPKRRTIPIAKIS